MIKSLLPNVKESLPTINNIVVNKTEINNTACQAWKRCNCNLQNCS